MPPLIASNPPASPPDSAPPAPSAAIEDPSEQFRFLLRVPWEKIAIWAGFLTLIYSLRAFFDIIFMTFIFSYMTKGAVDWVLKKLGAGPKSEFYRRTVVKLSFTLLLALIVVLGMMVVPRFYDQANLFVKKLQQTKIRVQLEAAVEKVVGKDSFADLKKTEWFKDQIDDLVAKAEASVPMVTGWVAQALLSVLTVLFHFFLSMIFSLLIVLDIPKLGERICDLEEGRFKNFYREIVPTLLTFGTVLGRAFQAQAAIAACNTVLTLLGLLALGIQSPVFLCTIVFFCSFIPVLGVFISSIPIALMTFQQEGIGLTVEAILLIVVIHVIEAYVLNPKIMGDMLKMHPLIVLIILLLSEYYFGVWGLLLGVPISFYVYRYVIQGKTDEAVLASPLIQGLEPRKSPAA